MSRNPLLKFLDLPLYNVTLCIAGARSVGVNEIKAVHQNLKYHRITTEKFRRRLGGTVATLMKEHTQSLGKLKENLILIFHLNSTHLAELFFH